MAFLVELRATLAFRSRAIQSLGRHKSLVLAWCLLGSGLLVHSLIRDWAFGSIDAPGAPPHARGLFTSSLHPNLLQVLAFLALVYVPAVICLSNAIAGDGFGFSFSREEYRTHVAALFPLWGALLLATSPEAWLATRFLEIGPVGISAGLLLLGGVMAVYSVWAIKELNHISMPAAAAVLMLSLLTIPVLLLLTAFLFALPMLLLLPVFYLVLQRLQSALAGRFRERDFQHHLHSLTVNPQDADAHYQLGLIHMKRGHLDAARSYFETALKIEPGDPDYHYYLGRIFEEREEWQRALARYEEVYRLNPHYGLGDICREVGKGYLHTGAVEKAMEFLRFFLEARSSDPEGRYWLAVTLQKLGWEEEARVELRALLEQSRSLPRFFRKENRAWLYRARTLLRRSQEPGGVGRGQ